MTAARYVITETSSPSAAQLLTPRLLREREGVRVLLARTCTRPRHVEFNTVESIDQRSATSGRSRQSSSLQARSPSARDIPRLVRYECHDDKRLPTPLSRRVRSTAMARRPSEDEAHPGRVRRQLPPVRAHPAAGAGRPMSAGV